jgi:signal transduction histidine kinase
MRKKLLFVDDDQNFLSGIARSLRHREQEWELILTTSVPKAFQQIRENNIDVIVSDVFMPGTGGMELLEFLKNGIQARTIPIIMITGKNDAELKRRAIELGATDILNKPVEPEELMARLVSSLLQKEYMDQITQFNATLVQKVNKRTRELLDANKNLEKAREEAELASKTKSAFLKNISHELRTPLNTIIGFSEMIEINLINKNEGVEFVPDLKRINVAGRQLLNLIDDILSFSRVETGKMDLDPIHFELSDLLSEIDMIIRPLTKGGEYTITYEGDIEGPKLFADRAKIKQILFNLMKNAINFTHSGHIILTVMRKNLNNGFVSFEISDTGIGMTKKQVEDLFRPFVQGDSSNTRRQRGAGLGLAISKNLAHFLGGDILVESKIDVGSTFTLSIPAMSLGAEYKPISTG